MNLNFTVKNRDKSGAKEARKLRLQGFVPGIIYGDHKDPLMVSVSEKGLTKECSTSSFFNSVLTLNINGSQVERVLPKEVAYHPVTGRVIHVDFMRISKGSKVKIQIPVETINNTTLFNTRSFIFINCFNWYLNLYFRSL